MPCAVPTPPGSVAEENEHGGYDYGSYSYSEYAYSRRVLSTVGAEFNTTECVDTVSGSVCAITCVIELIRDFKVALWWWYLPPYVY